MTKFSLLLLSTLLLFTACNTPPAAQDSDISSRVGASAEADALDQIDPKEFPNQASLAGQFQSFFIDPDQVKILDSNMVEWPDTCLGIEQPGVDCIPQSTPGYAVLLEADGLKFAYHSDEVGNQVHPATQGLIWTREGGQEGLCDRLIIYLPDTALVCWCDSGEINSASVNLQDILSEQEYHFLIESIKNFSENTINQPSSDQSDPVMVSLTFYGQGTTFPNSDQQESLSEMAELIFSRIVP